MDKLRIRGGQPLTGTVRISGSKNAALPILLAAPLLSERTVIENVPRLRDIQTTLKLLDILGCPSTFEDGTVTIEPCKSLAPEAPYDLVRTMPRSSIGRNEVGRCRNSQTIPPNSTT